jgi:hypothetical protein
MGRFLCCWPISTFASARPFSPSLGRALLLALTTGPTRQPPTTCASCLSFRLRVGRVAWSSPVNREAPYVPPREFRVQLQPPRILPYRRVPNQPP